MNDLFGEVTNYTLLELLSLKAIFSKLLNSGRIIKISEISNKVVAYYWHLEFNNNNKLLYERNLNDVKSKILKKRVLVNTSTELDIEQVLTYEDNRSYNIMLYGLLKKPLKTISIFVENKGLNEKFSSLLVNNRLDQAVLFEFIGKDKIQVSLEWEKYVKQNIGIIKIVDSMIVEMMSLDKETISDILNKNNNKKIIVNKPKEVEEEANLLELIALEKKLNNHKNFTGKKYGCLEEALSWLKMDIAKYESLHNEYSKLIKKKSVKKAAERFPLVTACILLYTAVYRYNTEKANGFWPEFFGKEKYNATGDVKTAMNCLKTMCRNYRTNNVGRRYLEKANMSKVFSEIYLPETSLKKIYTALYSYYFRSRYGRVADNSEFMEYNQYRLDKEGIFFLDKDYLIEDVFYKIFDLVENSIQNGVVDNDKQLPDRFYGVLEAWISNEKEAIDSSSEEYYISKPKIILDNINESINIYLPKQKSKVYSDEECGWEILIDGNKTFVESHIIRQKNGSYLILDDKFQIKPFKTLNIKYFFNNENQGEWDINFDNKKMIFDNKGFLQNSDTLKRSGCYIGLTNEVEWNNKIIKEKVDIDKWDDYQFYYVSLVEYNSKELEINNYLTIPIEDKPTVTRNNYKSLFENYNEEQVLYDEIGIYENIGVFNIISPCLKDSDIKSSLINVKRREDESSKVIIEQVKENRVRVIFNSSLESGFYNFVLKYKNKTFYREKFVLDKQTVVNYNTELSYEKTTIKDKRIEIKNGPNVIISSSDLDTRVFKKNDKYIVESHKNSVARFIYQMDNLQIAVKKILRPIKIEVLGLEDIIERVDSNVVDEITKRTLEDHKVEVYVRNLDIKPAYLIYKLKIIDAISHEAIVDVRKLKIGEENNWKLNDFKDRILDVKNIILKLEVSDASNFNIYDKVLLRIKQQITMNDFTEIQKGNRVELNWKEKQINKNRKICLYNLTMPSEKALEIELEDGKNSALVDLSKLKSGIIVPILEFRKESSPFEEIDENIKFFERKEIKYIFENKVGIINCKGERNLADCVWMIYERKYEAVVAYLFDGRINKVPIEDVLFVIVQMKYLAGDDELAKDALLNINYKIIKQILKYSDKNSLLKSILGLDEVLKKKDLLFLLMSVLSIDNKAQLKPEIIDDLAEIDLISSLCAVQNNDGRLTKDLIMKCRKSFDKELLEKIVGNPDKVFQTVGKEINIMSEFWSWVASENKQNRNLLKKDYSKARLFRMYESEKGITTYRVASQMIDDIVGDVKKDNEEQGRLRNLSCWSKRINIDKALYDGYLNFIDKYNARYCEEYRDILQAAFIDVSKLNTFSEYQYYELRMKNYLSSRKDIYNRYRAYFKLIFI